MTLHEHTKARAAIVLVVAILAFAVPPAVAEEIDRIVAVVGSEIILLSELDEEVYLEHLRDRLDLKDDSAVDEYRRAVLEGAVEAKLLLEEARRQGLHVTREEVDRAVDGMIADVRSRFATATEFQRQLEAEGSSEEQLRESYRGKLKEQLLVRQLVDRTVRTRVTVEDHELRAYWEEHRSEVPPVPTLLHLRRILVSGSAAAGVDSAAVERGRIVRGRIDEGEKFATLARVFSEGPNASSGGDLGWFHTDDLEPALRDAVKNASEGHVTPVLVTHRGAHILRVDATRGESEVRLSQIVFLHDVEAVRAAARARAETILARLEAGEEFAVVAKEESDDTTTRERGGDLGAVPLDALGPAYRDALAGLSEGALSGVIEDGDALAIFRLDRREGEREATFEEMEGRIRTILEQEKGKAFYDELVEQSRDATYVELRLDTEG